MAHLLYHLGISIFTTDGDAGSHLLLADGSSQKLSRDDIMTMKAEGVKAKVWILGSCHNSWGGGTPIHKLYGDVSPFRVWFFDSPLTNRVSNSKIFEKIFINRVYKNQAF